MPKIIAISDLHGTLPQLPTCDVLLVGGDVCPRWDHTVRFQLSWLDTNFRIWLSEQPAKVIVGIAGNHDFVFERWPDDVTKLGLPWVYLKDQRFNALGISIYGLPWVPNLSRWAFHDDDHGLDVRYAQIPEDVDIVLSHGPPHGFRDMTVPKFGSCHAGFPGANDMLERVRPKAFVCGHIHEGYGVEEHPSGATIYNVSHMTEDYEPINGAMEIAVPSPTWPR